MGQILTSIANFGRCTRAVIVIGFEADFAVRIAFRLVFFVEASSFDMGFAIILLDPGKDVLSDKSVPFLTNFFLSRPFGTELTLLLVPACNLFGSFADHFVPLSVPYLFIRS